MGDRELRAIARRFQRQMEKLDMGVTLSTSKHPDPVSVTTVCAVCGHAFADIDGHMLTKHKERPL